jgi:hypothetical protein
MKARVYVALFALAAAIITCSSVAQQPPPDGPPGGGKGPGGPPRFELGRVLPPPLMEQLDLTAEQKEQLTALEKEVKERLNKILTAEQKKKVEDFRPRGPGGPGGPGGFGGPGGPGGGDGPPQKKGRDDQPKKGKDDQPKKDKGDKPAPPTKEPGVQLQPNSQIQWFATLERGQAEAKRTGMPILFLSAAPHCGGVSGIW